ncbi:hypothetical protein E3N88_30930 [Mikania micrantha]|uniref:PB1 domain-containing protein n=1 Tax=Mikania micrantha TaxID=192012 RepID=A0A5N6MNV2_9ASTR|nr:hypothetical protein E3N88_30930 [Mikania micrantha]
MTRYHVLDKEDQHSRDIGARGQLVLLVFFGNELVGVIEYVTPRRKESYVEDFEQFQNLLEDTCLKATYIGKMIKVEYDGHTIKFGLPLSASLTDLLEEVTKRFTYLRDTRFRVEHEGSMGIYFPISSDEALQECMNDSSFQGVNYIKMHVTLEDTVLGPV